MREADVLELIKKGTEEQLAGNFNEAEGLYRKVLEEKDGPVVHNNLGFLFLQQQNYPEAIAEFKEAIKLKADYATAYKHLGYAYLLSGETELAIEATKECFEIDPTDGDVAETLAKYYFLNSQWGFSAYYRKSAYELSGNPENLTELSYALLMEHKFKDAIDILEQMLSNFHTNSSRVYALLATAYMMTQNMGFAISNYKQALGIEPENIEARNNMALCLLQTGNYNDAMLEFKRVVMLQPDHHEARNNLAVLEIAAEQNESALEHFDIILQQQPENVKALYYKSGLLYQQGLFGEAAELLERLIATADQNYRSKALEMLSDLKKRKN